MNKQKLFYILLLTIPLCFFQCAENVDSRLKKIAEEANSKCPKVLDKWTRLDSCIALPHRTYRLYHTISDLVITDTTLFKSKFQPEIVSGVKTNPDMKYFRDNDVSIIYQYNDQYKNYLFTIVITPKQYKK